MEDTDEHDTGGSVRRRGSRLKLAVAVVTVLLLVDVAFGAVLTGTGVLPPLDRGDVYRLEHAASTGQPQALRNEPWAAQLNDDLIRFQSERYEFAPYLQNVTYEYHSQYINTTDTDRVSYEPPIAGRRPLRIAFFGGSVVFGIGQRDEHTIPSEFARIAEAAGVPVQVDNFGFPRWVAWQELLYFEQMMANDDDYDLAVFLDGYNEFYVQAEGLSSNPTLHAADALNAITGSFREERATPPGTFDGLHELLDQYHRNSAAWRIVDRLRGRQVPVIGTGTAQQGTLAQQTDAALGIYGRALARIQDVSDEHGVPVHFFWQPRAEGWPDEVRARLPEQVTDVSHVFDGREGELYFDTVHTNEEGAHILAQQLWDDVQGDLGLQAAP